jgi:heat shock protein HslJ/membrane-bound inhibitor of C-type lysozyme
MHKALRAGREREQEQERERHGIARRAALVCVTAALAACATPGPGPVPPAGPAPGTTPPATAPAAPPRLAGSSWYWLGTVTPAGLVTPADPGSFNLEFLDGGQLAAQVDCNSGSGTWRQDGSTLKIGPLATTRKMCPSGTDAQRFGAQLGLVRSARFASGLLELELGDAGTMVLARDPDGRLVSFTCPSGTPPLLVAFGRDRAVVRWNGRSWAMQQQPSASGTRYGSGNAILFSKGNEATLVSGGRQVAGPCVTRR